MHFKIAAEDKTNHRYSGVLAHPTSFPSPYGVGDMGKEAYNFIDFLHMAGQHLWQVLPLGPCGNGNSPYQSFSVFAGQPLLISPDLLIEKKLLTREDLEPIPEFNPDKVEYTKVTEYKTRLFRKAYQNFRHTSDKDLLEEYDSFQKNNEFWLEDYCLYMAGKDYHENLPWYEWEDSLLDPTPAERAAWLKLLEKEVDYYCFVQFCFFSQWYALKDYANEKGIAIIGDIPIYVALDSADVWTHPELFLLDEENLTPIKVAGVPPDAFSETGQLWGNPLYRWDVQEKTDFAWWKERMKASARLYDVVRIDHFIGVTQYYAIPAGSEDGKTGEWLKGPGKKLTDAINMVIGDTKIIAEDLGIFVLEVKELLEETGYPGMKIIEFAFSGDRFNEHLPHMYSPNSVVYGGTHDNETLVGYFKPEARQWWELQYIADYMGVSHQHEVVDKVLKTAYASVASVVIFQAQDVLKLDSWARMNTPGTVGNNWRWRMKPGELTQDHINHLSWLVDTFGRF